MKHRKAAKRTAEIGAGTILVLGLGAVVAGVVLYQFSKPGTASTTPAPGTLPPSGPATPPASTVLGPAAS